MFQIVIEKGFNCLDIKDVYIFWMMCEIEMSGKIINLRQ